MRCRRSLIRTSVVAAAAVSVLTAGCGGGSSTTGATITPSPLVAYSGCMRSHGVTGFPDPTSNGEIPKEKVVAAVVSNPRSPAAQRACRHLIPESGLGPPQTATPTRTRLADALSFARCVRAHGFPSFPDPTSQGQLTPGDGHRGRHRPASTQGAEGGPGLRAREPRPALAGGDRAGGTRRLSRPSGPVAAREHKSGLYRPRHRTRVSPDPRIRCLHARC